MSIADKKGQTLTLDLMRDAAREINRPPRFYDADCGHKVSDRPSHLGEAVYFIDFGDKCGEMVCYKCYINSGMEWALKLEGSQ